jgi:nucleoid-associated protein YgaU
VTIRTPASAPTDTGGAMPATERAVAPDPPRELGRTGASATATAKRTTPTAVALQLEAVGPGVPEAEPLPRWARRSRPLPISVRWLNTLTEGTPFRVILAALLAIGVSAGAWAVATTNQELGVTPLVVPSPASATVLPTETPADTASPLPTPTPPWERRYVVRDGDTLAAIAEAVYGDETLWPLILEANEERIADPEHLRIGTSLLIPNE